MPRGARAGVDRTRSAEPAGSRRRPPIGPPGRGPLKPPGRGRAAEPAGPRPAGAALLTRPRFADRERPSLEGLLIESPDGFFGDAAIGVIDEREASRTAGFPIDGQDDGRGFADAGEVLAQLGFRRRIRKIADEQTD